MGQTIPLTFILSPESVERKSSNRATAPGSDLLSPCGRGRVRGGVVCMVMATDSACCWANDPPHLYPLPRVGGKEIFQSRDGTKKRSPLPLRERPGEGWCGLHGHGYGFCVLLGETIPLTFILSPESVERKSSNRATAPGSDLLS